jgi:cytochrome c biogenesis protein CcmG/thiol:disulfide interchange protein DsbE
VVPAPNRTQSAPDFSLSALDGQPLRLSSYRGKIVVLDFWATWCAPCREEIPHFIQMQNQYGNRGVQLIGISMDDSPEPVRSFYQQFKMNYPVAVGNAKLGELYGGILGLPITYVIGRDGKIEGKYIGATDVAVIERRVQDLLQEP